ncbi:GPW/gp25 family protein [Akkermansia glycaniphila]|uniref:Gene 25-like lysozyme n=1 Tax=Akkermansia glycaniphila TaxID=1679444 RepID=A0A1C7PBT4_9BACT|nr:GPW/gp25 family protein [Akkermansia glycaniphila]OCA03060.1 hypothetical protein AC781_06740 [Akkermansia glycaniphila]SEH86451.1 gene 25-like lysozyme [Akkermansia glycaniphila]
MNDNAFLGKGWSFPPEFGKRSHGVNMVDGDEDIQQSLCVLLSCSPGERVHRPDYGCDLRRYAFEAMDTAAQTLLRNEIERAVILFEPRIRLISVEFKIDHEQGILRILLDYTINSVNRRSNMVYPFYLNEGTDLIL